MPTITKRELVRRTHDLLNNNGLHWTKGEFLSWKWIEEKQKEIRAYCAVGGFRHALGVDPEQRPDFETPEGKVYLETITDLATILRGRYPGRFAAHLHAEDVIINWNDDPDTDWNEINTVLSQLALMKAQKASAPAPSPASLGL